MQKELFGANGITSYGSGGEEDFNLTGGIDTNATENQDTQKKEIAMSKVRFEGQGHISLGSVNGEEDLKSIPGKININPPPSDGRCDGCGRHLSQLKPFGKAGDPLVGDFNGALLIKNFRWDAPPDEEIEKIMKEFFGACSSSEDYDKAEKRLIEQYGQEEAEGMMFYHQLSNQVGKSWECRDCICLSNKRFHLMRINLFYPPPSSDKCDCCGRHLSELKPSANGAIVLRKSRPGALYNEIMHKIYAEFFGNRPTEKDSQKAKEKLVQKYGEEMAESIIDRELLSSSLYYTWECKECTCLDDYGFFDSICYNLDQPESCNCCGRRLDELRPLTEGDPKSYFNRKPLARKYRIDALPTEEANKMMDKFFGNCITYEDYQEAQVQLIQKYGEEEAKNLWVAFFLVGLFKRSWECKDCIALSTHQYFEKRMAQESDSGPDSPG